MSFDEEWRQIKAETTANQASVHLDSAGSDTDRVNDSDRFTPTLAVPLPQLSLVGHDAYDLWHRMSSDGKHADHSTAAAAKELSSCSFRTGSALSTVHTTWDSQVKTLADACAVISNDLRDTVGDHQYNDMCVSVDMTPSQISKYLK